METVEWCSLQAVTRIAAEGGHAVLCNGANMGVKRDVFLRYLDEGAQHASYASGDDMFLLAYCKGKVRYVADAVVDTKGAASLRAFVRQRLRWAGKATAYRDKVTMGVALGVLLLNTLLLVAMVVWAARGAWGTLAGVMAVKMVAEGCVIAPQAKRFGQLGTLWCLPIASLLYPLYATAVGWGSLLWKKDKW